MYSEKEVKMFTALGFEELLERLQDEPVTMYRIVSEEAFIKDLRGPLVDSLRRCLSALRTCSMYRMTDEFDALIQLGEEDG